VEDDAAAQRWLRAHRSGAAPAAALAFFDSRPAVDLPAMVGRWRGTELPTGSRLDGLLTGYGWYGKQVVDAETVHPLLFPDRTGVPRPVDPAYVPLGLFLRSPWLARVPGARLGFAGVRPLLRTDRPAARLRLLEHRGVVSAALVYDRLPIIDVLRRVSADTVLGLMDLRGLDEPFLFVLEREPATAR
jgi:hypothetical protein